MTTLGASSARQAIRCGFTLLVTLIVTAVPGVAQTLDVRQNFDPALVAQQFHSTDPQLRVVVAHRGIWKNNECPENSVCSFYDAKQRGIEAVEVDVKRSKSGSLWALHDRYIGRVTTYRPAGQANYFDQSRPMGPGNGNALVSDLTNEEIGALYLRYANGDVSKYHPYTLREILDNIKSEGHVATMLDLKTDVDVQDAAALVRTLGMERTVILKFPSSIYDPNQVPAYLNGMLYAPVVYAQDLLRIAADGGVRQGLPEAQQRVEGWLLDAQNSNAPALYIEYGLKSPDGQNPLRFAYNFSIYSLVQAVGSFQPVPDASGGRFYLDGGGYFTLDEFLTKNIAPFPDETADDRENSDFMLHYMNSIITDDPVSLISLATEKGYRSHVANLCFNHDCAIN